MVIACLTRRWVGQMTAKARAIPLRYSGRPRPPARRARTGRAVTLRSRAWIARCTSMRTSSGGRRRHGSIFFRRTRRRSIGLLPATRRPTRGRGSFPRTYLTRTTGPIAGRVTTPSTAAGELFLPLLTARQTGHSSGNGRRSIRHGRRRCHNTRSDCSYTWSRSSQYRNSRARNAANRSLG